jgi:hypothetical protein
MVTLFAVVVVATVYSFTVTPIYEARAKLLIDVENPNVVDFKEVIEQDRARADYYQTTVQLAAVAVARPSHARFAEPVERAGTQAGAKRAVDLRAGGAVGDDDARRRRRRTSRRPFDETMRQSAAWTRSCRTCR